MADFQAPITGWVCAPTDIIPQCLFQQDEQLALLDQEQELLHAWNLTALSRELAEIHPDWKLPASSEK